MSADYDVELDGTLGAWMHVEFTTVRRDVVDYSIVLLVEVDRELETVRLYDGAHAENELHRYTRKSGKQPAEIVHHGDLGAGITPSGDQTLSQAQRTQEAAFRYACALEGIPISDTPAPTRRASRTLSV